MSRTLSDITDELLGLAHSLWSETVDAIATIRGLASVFVDLETKADSLKDKAFRQTAEGAYLDEIGRDVGEERYPWEDDETYREHAFLKTRGPTPANLLRELDRVIIPDGYNIEFVEPRSAVAMTGSESDAQLSEHGLFVGDMIFPEDSRPKYLWWLRVPIVENQHLQETFVATGDFYADDSNYIDAHDRNTRRRFFRYVERVADELRTHSGEFGITIEDTVEQATFDFYFRMKGPI